MCGIYGWQVAEGQHLSTFEASVLSVTMADAMESRGKLAYGGVVWKNGSTDPTSYDIFRRIGGITECGSELLRATSKARQVLVHTRQPTQGSNTVENTHPFVIGDIVGVHNGVVWNHEHLGKLYDRKFSVDSQHIFAHLDSKLPIEEIDGYGVVVWMRTSEQLKRIYIGRSTSGTIHAARLFRSPEKKQGTHFAVIFASTSSAVSNAAKRVGLFYEPIEIKGEVLYAVEGGEIYDTEQRFPFSAISPTKFDRRTGYGGYGGYGGSASASATGAGWEYDYDEFDAESAYDRWKRTVEVKATKKNDKKSDKTPESKSTPTTPRIISGPSCYAAIAKEKYVTMRDGLRFTEPYGPMLVTVEEGRLIKVYNRKDQPHAYIYTCPECYCDVEKHHYGWCDDQTCSKRKDGKKHQCRISIPVCADCGCYFVDPVHTRRYKHVNGDPKAIYFVECVCGNRCRPDTDRQRAAVLLQEFTSKKEEGKAPTPGEAQRAEEVVNEAITKAQIDDDDTVEVATIILGGDDDDEEQQGKLANFVDYLGRAIDHRRQQREDLLTRYEEPGSLLEDWSGYSD